MARQTRAQRRARRAQQAGQADSPSVSQRARSRQPVRPQVAAVQAERRPPGGGVRQFIAESWGELKKVEWPTQQQVIQGTIVVLIACAIVGAFLYANDLIWRRAVHAILGI